MCLCILLAQFGSTEGEKNEEAQSNLVSGISDEYEVKLNVMGGIDLRTLLEHTCLLLIHHK